jgi:hypothetical protein|tara:strand:+ start:102 stop:683 length:582 start_codon:yes stop_codon:yes gene_type:complete
MEYYVYKHTRLKDGSTFYIGKGKGKRFSSEKGRNDYWNRIVRKDGGFTVEILKEGLSNDEACELEIKLISDIGLSNLSNLAEGGQGGDTRKGFTKEEYDLWLKRKSEAQTGKTSYWKDKERPKHSQMLKSKHEMGVYDYKQFSEPKSDEHKQKMSESAIERIRPMVKCVKCGKEVPNTHIAQHQRGKKCITIN